MYMTRGESSLEKESLNLVIRGRARHRDLQRSFICFPPCLYKEGSCTATCGRGSERENAFIVFVSIDMGWSEMEGRCRRHPKHRQSKGVCPSCLRERLSQLSTSSTFSSPGSFYDSASSSAPSSSPVTPSAIQNRRGRGDVTKKVALLMKENLLLGRASEPLTKSRSLAFVISNPLGGLKEKKEKPEMGKEEEKKKNDKGDVDGEGGEEKKKKTKNKKRGFWSNLAIGGNMRKEKDALFRSKTVRETSSARWAFLP